MNTTSCECFAPANNIIFSVIYIFSELHKNFKVHVFHHTELVNVRVKKLVKYLLLDKTSSELTYMTS